MTGPTAASSSGAVIGFGAVSVDRLVVVDAPLAAGKGRVVSESMSFGGNVATALAAAARLGARAEWLGWLGEDDGGVAADFAAMGVSTDRAVQVPGTGPIRATVIVGADGERFIAFDDAIRHGADREVVLAALPEAAVLLVDAYAQTSPDLVEAARYHGVAVVADLEWGDGPGFDRLFAACDHLIVPLAAGQRFTGRSDPSEAVRAIWSPGRRIVALTDGARGMWLQAEGETAPHHLPAHDVTVIDTTGCGDVLHGAYAALLALGADPPRAIVAANAAAALAATAVGGRGALPDRVAVDRLLQRADLSPGRAAS